MGEDAMLGRSALSSTVDRLVERFATRCGGTANPRQLRDLAESLVLDVVGAMRTASIAHIADAVAQLERRRKNRPPIASDSRAAGERTATERRPVGRDASRPTPSRASAHDHATMPSSAGRGSSAKRDAFDITRPSELLDTATVTVRREEQPPSSVRRMREPRSGGDAVSAPAAGSRQPPVVPEPTDVRAPAVTLREGEQLVRSTGSGVVIRRIRSA